mgnify:FL=1
MTITPTSLKLCSPLVANRELQDLLTRKNIVSATETTTDVVATLSCSRFALISVYKTMHAHGWWGEMKKKKKTKPNAF